MREAERREQAALKYAEGVKNELNDTKTKLTKVDQNLFSEYNSRVNTQLDTTKSQLKQAHEEQDTDKIIEAQEALAKLSVESESLSRLKKEQEEERVDFEARSLQQPQQIAPPPKTDPKAEEWARRNNWFGEDIAMTSSAFAFHRQLTEDQGMDATSDEYYEKLDNSLKEAFPHRFEQANKPVQAVAGGSVGATTINKPKKVKLTSSQVAIAKKLGVPLTEYAKHVQ
jgi:primosomal protein N''